MDELAKKNKADYPLTVKRYLAEKENIDKMGANKIFQEGSIVWQLLIEGYSKENLIKAVAEHTVVEYEGTPQDYAKYIVNSASAEMKADRNISEFIHWPGEVSLTLDQVYLKEAQNIHYFHNPEQGRLERFLSSKEPSVAVVDVKVAERLISQNFDLDEIKKTIEKMSPATKMPGIAPNYAQQVIEKVKQMNPEKGENDLLIDLKKTQGEYYRQIVNLARSEGKSKFDLSEAQDGQIVKSLLEQGYLPKNVAKAVVEFSPIAFSVSQNPFFSVSKEQYAFDTVFKGQDEINSNGVTKSFDTAIVSKTDGLPEYTHMDKTQLTKDRRIMELSNVEIISDNVWRNTPKAYINEAAIIIRKEKGWTGPEADVKITQSLLLQGYEKGKISAVINKQSPEIIGKTQEEAKKYANEITKKALTPEIKKQMPIPEKAMAR